MPTPQKALVNMMETFQYDACDPDSTRVQGHSFGNVIQATTCLADMYRVPLPNGQKWPASQTTQSATERIRSVSCLRVPVGQGSGVDAPSPQ